jgi:hypothetical protein
MNQGYLLLLEKIALTIDLQKFSQQLTNGLTVKVLQKIL